MIPRFYASVIAGGLGTAGLLMLRVEHDFVTPSTSVAFDTFTPRTWGLSFLATSVLFVLLHKRRAAAAPMSFVMTAWSAMLAWASLTVDGASTTAWVWPTTIALCLTFGIARGDL